MHINVVPSFFNKHHKIVVKNHKTNADNSIVVTLIYLNLFPFLFHLYINNYLVIWIR